MEPQFDKSPAPGLALPQPQLHQGVEQGAPSPYGSESGVTTPEMGMPPVVQSSAAVPLQPTNGPVPLPIPQAGPVADASPLATSAQADTADELDRELISKAKAIVERTKSDPYLESNELNKAKAEYLRMRYNKHIKVTEEHTK